MCLPRAVIGGQLYVNVPESRYRSAALHLVLDSHFCIPDS